MHAAHGCRGSNRKAGRGKEAGSQESAAGNDGAPREAPGANPAGVLCRSHAGPPLPSASQALLSLAQASHLAARVRARPVAGTAAAVPAGAGPPVTQRCVAAASRTCSPPRCGRPTLLAANALRSSRRYPRRCRPRTVLALRRGWLPAASTGGFVRRQGMLPGVPGQPSEFIASAPGASVTAFRGRCWRACSWARSRRIGRPGRRRSTRLEGGSASPPGAAPTASAG